MFPFFKLRRVSMESSLDESRGRCDVTSLKSQWNGGAHNNNNMTQTKTKGREKGEKREKEKEKCSRLFFFSSSYKQKTKSRRRRRRRSEGRSARQHTYGLRSSTAAAVDEGIEVGVYDFCVAAAATLTLPSSSLIRLDAELSRVESSPLFSLFLFVLCYLCCARVVANQPTINNNNNSSSSSFDRSSSNKWTSRSQSVSQSCVCVRVTQLWLVVLLLLLLDTSSPSF